MTLTVYLHPLSSCCQKAKAAFYEKDVPFETKLLDGSDPVAGDFAALWPIVPRRRRFSTRTGLTRSRTALPMSEPIARGCWCGQAMPARSTKRGPIATCFRSAHPRGVTAGRHCADHERRLAPHRTYLNNGEKNGQENLSR